MTIWRGKSSAPSLLPQPHSGGEKEGKEGGNIMEKKAIDDKIEEMLEDIRELTLCLEYIRDEVVFGNKKHVERINDVLKKNYKKGEIKQ
jgi:hypothetical protein